MAKKKKGVPIRGPNGEQDPEAETPDAEKLRREDERGRIVLAMVGKAIQAGTKIPLDWHPVYRTPCGTRRKTFCRYIGVVVRERVCITYVTWKDVPKELKDLLYDSITVSYTYSCYIC